MLLEAEMQSPVSMHLFSAWLQRYVALRNDQLVRLPMCYSSRGHTPSRPCDQLIYVVDIGGMLLVFV